MPLGVDTHVDMGRIGCSVIEAVDPWMIVSYMDLG